MPKKIALKIIVPVVFVFAVTVAVATFLVLNNNLNILVDKTKMIVFALATIIAVSTVLSVLVLHTINRPISRLVSAMAKVEQGELSTRVDISAQDEIGRLTASFNSMVESLEKAKKELELQHEAQLFHMDKLASLGEIALGVAHEIKNPLASIASSVQVIKESRSFDHQYDGIVEEMLKQIKRIDKTIKDLLIFARPSEPRFVKGSAVDIIDRSILLIKNQAEIQRIDIETEYDDQCHRPLMLDPELLQQAFLNILLNSIQAMPEGGLIRVNASAGDGNVCISFSDTGKGIPDSIADKIFVPFFTTKPQGTGLGLFISRNIVAKHQGKIFLENKYGTGCTFKILLPLLKKGEQFE